LKRIATSIPIGSSAFTSIGLQQKNAERFALGTEGMIQTKPNVATFAYTLVASSSLFLFAMDVNLAYPHEFQAAAGRVDDSSAVATASSLAPSAALDPQIQQIDQVPPAVHIALSDPEIQPSAVSERADRQTPASVPVTLSAPTAVSSPTRVEAPSPTRITFFSFPRQLNANVARLTFHAPSLAPMAFMRFCMRYPDDCKISAPLFRSRPISLTSARRAELVQVNREVNRAIKPQANIHGVLAEEWLLSPREGDCNDYAVTKRHELLQRGWPSRALLLAEVVVASGEHHLILVVRTREEDLALDNLNWNVRPVAQIQYEWVRAQQANNPKFWSTAGVAQPSRVAMNNR
jgi:predicted transglutaminase-like cysteine proteinase